MEEDATNFNVEVELSAALLNESEDSNVPCGDNDSEDTDTRLARITSPTHAKSLLVLSSVRNGSQSSVQQDADHVQNARLPRSILQVLNEEWSKAGNKTPSKLKIEQVATSLGFPESTRIRKFYTAKTGRLRRKEANRQDLAIHANYGPELVKKIEDVLFDRENLVAASTLADEVLYDIAELERMGPLRDIGMSMVKILEGEAATKAIHRYVQLYWNRMKAHFLNPRSKGRSAAAVRARHDEAASPEVSML